MIRLASGRRRRRRGGWRRPLTYVAAAAVLAAVGVGGWATATRVFASRAAYTKGALTWAAGPVSTQPVRAAPAEFQASIARLAAGYGEPVGISVSEVSQGWVASAAGDEVFPQQSVSKLWVALAVLQAVDRGQLQLDRTVTMLPQDRSVFYQPITRKIRGPDGFTITLADLMRNALIESDNAANDRLVRELGGAQAVTRTIADKRLQGVAVGGTERDMQTRTAGLTWKPEYGQTWIFKQARAQLPDDVRDRALAAYLADPPDGATPNGIVTGLAALKRGELLSPSSTAFMLELMGEARTGQMRLRAGLTPGWRLAHKTGTGPDWRGASVGINDVGLLTAPDGRTFAVAVMIRQTRQGAEARHRLMRDVAHAVEAYWQAGDPAPGGSAPVFAGAP